MDIKELFKESYIGKDVTICGWIKNHRKQAKFGFIDLFDGTYFKSVQIVYTDENSNFEEIQKILIGSSIEVPVE